MSILTPDTPSFPKSPGTLPTLSRCLSHDGGHSYLLSHNASLSGLNDKHVLPPRASVGQGLGCRALWAWGLSRDCSRGAGRGASRLQARLGLEGPLRNGSHGLVSSSPVTGRLSSSPREPFNSPTEGSSQHGSRLPPQRASRERARGDGHNAFYDPVSEVATTASRMFYSLERSH